MNLLSILLLQGSDADRVTQGSVAKRQRCIQTLEFGLITIEEIVWGFTRGVLDFFEERTQRKVEKGMIFDLLPYTEKYEKLQNLNRWMISYKFTRKIDQINKKV